MSETSPHSLWPGGKDGSAWTDLARGGTKGTTYRCVCKTPLGLPVVPLVYMMRAPAPETVFSSASRDVADVAESQLLVAAPAGADGREMTSVWALLLLATEPTLASASSSVRA